MRIRGFRVGRPRGGEKLYLAPTKRAALQWARYAVLYERAAKVLPLYYYEVEAMQFSTVRWDKMSPAEICISPPYRVIREERLTEISRRNAMPERKRLTKLLQCRANRKGIELD